jgi:hypothetical protein
LDALALAVGEGALPASADDDDDDDIEVKKQLLVKISPLISVRVVPSSELIASASTLARTSALPHDTLGEVHVELDETHQ